LGTPEHGEAAISGGGINIARLAQNCERVESFYASALATVAMGEGAPGLHDVHQHFGSIYTTANKLSLHLIRKRPLLDPEWAAD